MERGGGIRPTNSYSNGARSTSPLQPWCRRCLPNSPWGELMRTAVYVRVSTQRQSQPQAIDQQLARLRAHLAAHGEELQSEQIVRDDGYSGASLNRPGLDHLRDAVKAAACERILVTTPDRLARNYVHQMVLLGVRIDPAEGAVIRELFMRYLEAAETLRGLVKYGLGLGLPSPRGGARWSAASIRGMLTNPTYTGQVYSGRKRMRPARARRSATHPIGRLA
jgi:hypothetical protein